MRMSMSLRRGGWLAPPALLFLLLALLAPVASARTSPPSSGGAEANLENPSPSQSVPVIALGWSGSSGFDEPLPRETAGVLSVAESIPYLNETFAGVVRDTAPGILPNLNFFDGGELTIPPPQPFYGPHCHETEGLSFLVNTLRTQAFEGLEKQGLTPAELQKMPFFIIYLSQPLCGMSAFSNDQLDLLGMGSLVGQRELFRQFWTGRSAFSPAGTLRCEDAAGNPVPLSSTCTHGATDDEYDVMGDGVGAIGAGEAYQAGWLNGQFFQASEGLGSHTFTIKPYSELPHGARAIRLTDNGQTFWIEYRAAVGLDNMALDSLGVRVTPGLLVHRMTPGDFNHRKKTELIDMTPSATAPAESARNAGLPVGQTWSDPLGTMKVTLNAANAAGATVTISSQQSAAPDLVGDLVGEARAAIEGAGFSYGGAGTVIDPTCTSINRVTSQSPAAGTALYPGSSISITYGVKGPKQKCV